MEKIDKVLENYKNGYNCAQAVFCAFCEELDLSEDVAYKVSESFGKGMAGLGQTCGAVSGLFMIIGYNNSDPKKIGSTKMSTYDIVKEYGEKFKNMNNSLDCPTLKREARKSCISCMEDATTLAIEYFNSI